MITPAQVRKRVRKIVAWASDFSTWWQAENAERELQDDFVRYCIKADDPREVREIAGEIARCFDLDFERHYAEEEF